jgi:sulfur transfer protein SufE
MNFQKMSDSLVICGIIIVIILLAILIDKANEGIEQGDEVVRTFQRIEADMKRYNEFIQNAMINGVQP